MMQAAVRLGRKIGLMARYHRDTQSFMANKLDPTSKLFLSYVPELSGDQHVLLLGLLEAELVSAIANSLSPAGRLVIADYNSAALAKAASALKTTAFQQAKLISPDQLGDYTDASFDAAFVHIVPFPNRALLERLISEAGRLLKPNAMLYVGGPRDKGIVSVGTYVEELFGSAGNSQYAKGCRVITAVRPSHWQGQSAAAQTELIDIELRGQRLSLELRDGVFARGGLDDGSLMLIEAMQVEEAQQILDLGCGGGLVGMLAARLAPQAQVTLLDSNLAAVELARANLERNQINNARVLVSDVCSAVRDQQFDTIVTNPPFHQGRLQTTDTALRFFKESAQQLQPHGKLFIVCNRFLPYEQVLREIFASVQEVRGDGRFRVLLARHS